VEEIMQAYIEILSEHTLDKRELRKHNLWAIGEFTRENIASWLNRGPWFELDIYGWVDFHAVCGDIDIPWATEKAKNDYERGMRELA
jgi:hypothetical protein